MTATANAASPVDPGHAGFDPLQPAFDPRQRWVLHPSVAVRPEPFGALLYHFGTRRLSFLKDRRLLDVVRCLADQPSALTACTAAGVRADEHRTYVAALARLADSHMIIRPDEEPDVEEESP